MGGERRCKVVVIGEASVGKSSLSLKYVHGTFSANQQSTIGAAFLSRAERGHWGRVRLDIWDTAGQERYRSLAPMYYRGADAVVFVYDVTSRSSFVRVREWEKEVGAVEVKVFVGNKTDLPGREVERDEGAKYAEGKGHFFEASAKTGDGVHDVFRKVAECAEGKEAGGATGEVEVVGQGCC